MTDIRSEVRTSVNLTLDGVEIMHYPERPRKSREYFALAYFKAEVAAKKVASRLRSVYQNIRAEKRLAREALNALNVRKALLHQARARWMALQASGHEASYAVLRSELDPTANHLAGGEVVTLTSSTDWNDLLSKFQIVSVKGQKQKVVDGQVPKEALVARIVLQNGNTSIPAVGIPVRFQLLSGDGQLQAGIPVRTRGLGGSMPSAAARTDQNGEVACQIIQLNSGPAAIQTVTAAIDIGPLILELQAIEAASIAHWLMPLTELKSVFLLQRPNDLELTLPQWVQRQTRHIKSQKGWPKESRILIGAFSYRGSRAAGAFGQRLEREFRNGFSAEGTVVMRSDRNGEFPILRGEYWEDSKQIEVRTYLENRSGTQFVSSSAVLDRNQTGELKLKPENFEKYKAAVVDLSDPGTAVEEDFKINIWSDRGPRPVYQKDEKMKFFVKASNDCYLRLIYRTLDGTHVQIYPNKWGAADHLSANRVYAFPAADAGFEFIVQEPFGPEIVKAIVSINPLPQLEGDEADGVIILKETSLRNLMRKLRRPVIDAKTRYSLAEDEMVVNTVP